MFMLIWSSADTKISYYSYPPIIPSFLKHCYVPFLPFELYLLFLIFSGSGNFSREGHLVYLLLALDLFITALLGSFFMESA